MKSSHFRLFTAMSAIALGVGFTTPTHAADNATVTATLSSVGALVATNVAGMDFGKWFFNNPGANPNDIVLVKSPTTGVVTNTDNGTGTSTVVVANTTRAEQTVQITGGGASEDGTVVNVQHAAISNFGDTDAILSAITYQTASEGPTTMTPTTNYPVTIADGTAAESVYFGGTITVAGPVTAGANTATFLVTYSY